MAAGAGIRVRDPFVLSQESHKNTKLIAIIYTQRARCRPT